ncbi:MAG TPA: exo-beta-N-acetylmuramidase NamZ domain-containing protein, partial [Gemmataceae bacterium]|nr:exo-beta-N-acetylmuramidase NamZ domain-containing protein [Gemmataceae bacterium]
MSQRPRVGTGLMVLRDNRFAPLKGKRIGLVTHPAAVDDQLRPAAELIAEAPGVELAVLFGPEHGFDGVAQDLIGVADSHDAHLQIQVVSLYGA